MRIVFSSSNFRDLGGYRTGGGGRVRWGMVFRSGSLHRLTGADLATLGRLGLRVVYDLRTGEERDRAPSVLPAEVRRELLPIGGNAAKIGAPADVPPDFLQRTYHLMAEADAPVFGRLMKSLAVGESLPALIHCTAGKDRTGMSAALLLSVLGVEEATILDDYELSAVHFTERQLARLRLKLADEDVERYRALLGAPRHAMATVLATLRERYGGVETYLQEAAGVGPEICSELRARLVEPEVPDERD